MTRSGLLTRTARSPATTSAAGVFGMRPGYRHQLASWTHDYGWRSRRADVGTTTCSAAQHSCASRARAVVGAQPASALPLRGEDPDAGSGDGPRRPRGGGLRALQRGRLLRRSRARPVRLRSPLRSHLGAPCSHGPDHAGAPSRVVGGRHRRVPRGVERGPRLRGRAAPGRPAPSPLPDPGLPPRRPPGRRRRHASGQRSCRCLQRLGRGRRDGVRRAGGSGHGAAPGSGVHRLRAGRRAGRAAGGRFRCARPTAGLAR